VRSPSRERQIGPAFDGSRGIGLGNRTGRNGKSLEAGESFGEIAVLKELFGFLHGLSWEPRGSENEDQEE